MACHFLSSRLSFPVPGPSWFDALTEDVANYRRRRDEGRAAALADMTDQSRAMGGYDEPATFGPRRMA